MTREDLLAGNAGVAKELGQNIKKYCPDVKHVVIIFNPADITGLVTLLYAGLKPSQLTTLAALDSTRLQSALAKHFDVMQCAVKNCCTFGGHGEQMAVFASPVTIDGTPLLDIIGTGKAVNGKTLSKDEWEAMKKAVTQGGSAIIKLRGRSSFQSPAYVSVEMMAAAMGGAEFAWPAGCYADTAKYNHIMRYESASERYNKLLQNQPEVIKRAPLSYIASYLLMTPETLSRVRAQLFSKF